MFVLKRTSARLRELESLKVFLEDVCRLTDHIYHMNGKTVNYEESVWNMVLTLSQYPFLKFDDSGLLSGEENWNLHSSERPGSWNMLRRNLLIQTQLLNDVIIQYHVIILI